MDNTPVEHGGTKPNYSHAVEDAILDILPSPIVYWVKFESPFNVCVVEIFRVWRNGDMTIAQILSTLKSNTRRDTYRVYGDGHPCFTRGFE